MTAAARIQTVEAPVVGLVPVAEYLRVSRIGGRSGDGYISIPEQQRKNREHAAARGLRIVQTFKDEDYSGGNLERPEFQRCLALIRSGKVHGLVVATFDRFSRDEGDTFATLNEIESLGGRLWCGDGDVSMATSADALNTGIRTIFNAFDRRRKGEGMKDAVRAAITRGVHLADSFGYTRGEGRRLVPVDEEAALVRQMFELRAAGWSWARIADHANKVGPLPRARVRHRKGLPAGVEPVVEQARWNHKTVRGIVQKRVYLGEAWNGTNPDGSPKHITRNAHPAIVSHELWNAANRTKGTTHARPTDGYPLTGLPRCASCGYTMTHAADKRTLADGSIKTYRYYRCRATQHGAGRCQHPAMVEAEAAENFVFDEFEERYLDVERTLVEDDSALDDAKDALARAAASYTRALAQLNADEPSEAIRQAQEQNRDQAAAAVRRAEADLHDVLARARGGLLPGDLDTATFRNAPIPRKRHLLASVFRCVVVSGTPSSGPVEDRLTILLADEAPDGDALIDFIARRRWNRAEPRVERA